MNLDKRILIAVGLVLLSLGIALGCAYNLDDETISISLSQSKTFAPDTSTTSATISTISTPTTTTTTIATTTTTMTTATTTTTTTTTTTKPTRKITKKRAETTTTTTKSTTTATTATKSNGKSLGIFKIVGYSSEEATVGTESASGLPLIHYQTCAMNRDDMKRLGIKYGDYITVVGFGRLMVTDCGCKSGKVDVFCNTIKDAYKVTRKAEVLRG